MIEQEFTAAFLTPDGADREKQGLDTKGDQYYTLLPVTINMATLESYWPCDSKMHGKECCRARTNSGDEWTLMVSYVELRKIKKSLFATANN